MFSEKEITRLSKFMSLVLRHQAGTIGLTLDKNGWVATQELLDKMNKTGVNVTPEKLDFVVATNSKKRFAFNADKTQIRASQGHSVDIDLQLTPVKPPAVLYHGTGERSVASIFKTGLEKRSRRHVHLSADIETALQVGKRHGKPVVLTVDTAKMYKDGFEFYLSANKVWLTDKVPIGYLQQLN